MILKGEELGDVNESSRDWTIVGCLKVIILFSRHKRESQKGEAFIQAKQRAYRREESVKFGCHVITTVPDPMPVVVRIREKNDR